MGKIIFLDIDGTIRDFDGYIPESTVEAVRGARSNGHKVCISSGRPYFQIGESVKEIGFDGIVSGSGSYVKYEGKCVRHEYFSLLSYISLCEYMVKQGCVMELQTYKQCYVLKNQMEDYKRMQRNLYEKIGIEVPKQWNLPEIAESAMKLTEVEKINFFSNGFDFQTFLGKWGMQLYAVPLSIAGYEDLGGEISPKSVNKAKGIESVLEAARDEQGDAKSGSMEVIAFGDSENDIEMLRMAHVGVAMGNGMQKAKDAADMITAPLREDGLYKAFEQLQLI